MPKKAIVIGAGFSGLSAASSLAQKGFEVEVFEKHDMAGGRARKFEAAGFTFDMGPSWYWMPDVFDQFFEKFGKRTADYYELVRLDPSYRVWFGPNDKLDVPADEAGIFTMFETLEKGSSAALKKFLSEAKYKYDTGMKDLVFKPGNSITEFIDWRIAKGAFRLHLFGSFAKYIRRFFKNERILKLLEFPVLFLGAKPSQTPALYSLMNYADLSLGTWYPMGGMHKIAAGMETLAKSLGVRFNYNSDVQSIEVKNRHAVSIQTARGNHTSDVWVASADYHHVEQKLLPPEARTYSEKYWNQRTFSPSCLLYYVGVNKKVSSLLHHNLFFDEDFSGHAKEIYDSPQWPSAPLFYVSAPSVTDASVAPIGQENLFMLIPVAPGLVDTPEIREKYFNLILERIEKITGESLREHIIYKRSYAPTDFIEDYNACKGNGYGLANTLRQTAFLKPKMQQPKVKNLFFTGQLTTPGPGVPPSIISGQVAANEIYRKFNS